jgi:hypothetical protein
MSYAEQYNTNDIISIINKFINIMKTLRYDTMYYSPTAVRRRIAKLRGTEQ